MNAKATNLLAELDDNEPEKEPALKVGAATGVVAGVLSLIMYLAPDLLNETQLGTISVIGAFLVPVITAFFARGRVWSLASVKLVVEEAVNEALKTAEGLKKSTVRPPTPPVFPPDSSGFGTKEF